VLKISTVKFQLTSHHYKKYYKVNDSLARLDIYGQQTMIIFLWKF